MSAFNDFKQSNAWDERHDLPLAPQNNNPFIYMAYAMKIIKLADGINPMASKKEALDKFLSGCEKEPGKFDRWPDGAGGITSHDEVMGACYVSPEAAERIAHYLLEKDGEYNNKDEKSDVPERFNIYRMLWMAPFVKASTTKFRVSLFSQAQWALFVLIDALTYKRKEKIEDSDCGGRLRTWIMFEAFEKYALTNLVIKFWRSRMKKQGITPGMCLTVEPSSCPIYGQLAPPEF